MPAAWRTPDHRERQTDELATARATPRPKPLLARDRSSARSTNQLPEAAPLRTHARALLVGGSCGLRSTTQRRASRGPAARSRSRRGPTLRSVGRPATSCGSEFEALCLKDQFIAALHRQLRTMACVGPGTMVGIPVIVATAESTRSESSAISAAARTAPAGRRSSASGASGCRARRSGRRR
jgi:hypothetical protein